MNPSTNTVNNTKNCNNNNKNIRDKNNDGKVVTVVVGRGDIPKREEMRAIFAMCRKNQWNSVLRCVEHNPTIPITSMIMDNHISTTILHQAITSKGNTELRTKVIRTILDVAPLAATIQNGYGSLPLHVISQRNTKMDAPTKELLIGELVRSFRGALLQPGGVGKRTPLHIIFTDYISPRVTEMMIQNGPQACFMKDKKGFLPAHVACSRHCSPEKLRMLLEVHPESMMAKTNDGQTLLSLALSTATRSHPNYALIDALRCKMEEMGLPHYHHHRHHHHNLVTPPPPTTTSSSRSPRSFLLGKRSRSKRKVTDDSTTTAVVVAATTTTTETMMDEDNDPVNLLLHFSRHKDDYQEDHHHHHHHQVPNNVEQV